MVSEWRWGFACMSHASTGTVIYSDPDRGAAKDDLIKLWAEREKLMTLDQEFWSQEYYTLISWLQQHRHCEVRLSGPRGEDEPLPTFDGEDEPTEEYLTRRPAPVDDGDQVRLRELMSHRATVVLTEENVLRAVGLGGQGFTVLGVRDDFARQGVRIMVFHPDLPKVEEWCIPTDVSGTWGRELRVIDGVVWERSRLTVNEAFAQMAADGP